ncbi:hypothetical protein ACIBF6_43205 [Streptosporangium amethystogenes]|uniref:hypothetical protein n=1 Tax=Streptosporangium amethystogenes TaxID=2002 RepID=UPI0037BC6850
MSEGAGSSSRRGFLGWMGKIGVTTIGAIAGATAIAKPAQAANWRCCNLALPNKFCGTNSSGQYVCPPGYSMKVWHCCSGSRTYACGECTKGASCGAGPFICSAGWTVSANSCTV